VSRPERIAEMVRECRKMPGYRGVPILFNEDDHFDFDRPQNDLLAAVREYASWGCFDPGKSDYADEPRRIVTEAAPFGTLMRRELYLGQPLLSDDAGQFNILGLLHALCRLHAERSLKKLLPINPREQEAVERVRDAVWKYYQRLRAYRQSPTLRRKAGLARDFDRLFTRRTGFADLNQALRRIHEKRDDLLLVLERPEIPLHDNLSENDIREWAKKRKISAGTRSALGRRCRGTFVSLKKTCRKLGVSFWWYLQDRMRGLHDILPLPELLRQAARETQPSTVTAAICDNSCCTRHATCRSRSCRAASRAGGAAPRITGLLRSCDSWTMKSIRSRATTASAVVVRKVMQA
jgi:hypothetical protein